MKTFKILLLAIILTSTFACKADNKKHTNKFLATVDASNIKAEYFIKVALLLDTSNSMDGLINQAKAQLWEIVNELSYAKCQNERPKLQIALYEYGNDNLSAGDNYIRKILGFTEDLDDVSKELFSLTTNGGSEYCGAVIQESLNKLDWGNEDRYLKIIFIAGNEPFNQGAINYKDAAANALENGVVVNTIFCGNYSHGIDSYWKDGAQLTKGDYMAINQNQQTLYVSSPYDDVIIQLNSKLNKTYVPYGSNGDAKRHIQQTQDNNAAEYSKANAVSRTVSKGSHLYNNSTWDLVDAEEDANFSFKQLKKDDLPQELKGKTTTQIKKYLEAKRNERAAIQSEIKALNEQRRKYLAENTKEAPNELENAMIQAIKKQAEKKNYTWQ
ncbi:vWA domain-containing protein [Aequorivita flava]|uniref:VWA domain-containing protein n=1 Tax=Aequorivita flava TaxID=3114371 RepID=A0AB35YTZ2_9FLAO